MNHADHEVDAGMFLVSIDEVLSEDGVSRMLALHVIQHPDSDNPLYLVANMPADVAKDLIFKLVGGLVHLDPKYQKRGYWFKRKRRWGRLRGLE